MGVFQSVGGAATSGRGFTGRQVAAALRVAAEAQRKRHLERTGSVGSPHARSRSGVVQTLETIGDSAFADVVEYRSKDEESQQEMIVVEYAPEAFRYLRQLEGVQESQFSDEWTLPEEQLKLELGEGRSMAMFLKSKSMEFMCKTISDVEVGVLVDILRKYTEHLSNSRHSLLMRFLMLLKMQIGDEVGYILCFADIFAGCDMLNERWDIKGRRPKPGKYRQFPRWAKEQYEDGEDDTDNCPPPLAAPFKQGGPNAPSVSHLDRGKLMTRKDKDLTRLFWLEDDDRTHLLDQLAKDFHFLESCGLMDYSILLGVKYRHQSRLSPSRSMRMTFALGEEGQRDIREVRSRSQSRAASPGQHTSHYDPSVITHNSMYHYGVPSLQQHETYYIGIIDMLTKYNWKKKTANFCKTFLWRETTLSTIPPVAYRRRIDKYAHRIIATRHQEDILMNTVNLRDASEAQSAGC